MMQYNEHTMPKQTTSDVSLLNPPPGSVIYETELVYAALASYPITKGHTVVVWKKPVTDLGKLDEKDFAYLMFAVDQVRNALLKVCGVKKVYLMYMDEVKHVHWHLIPRYNTMGVSVLKIKPRKILKFPLVKRLHKAMRRI